MVMVGGRCCYGTLTRLEDEVKYVWHREIRSFGEGIDNGFDFVPILHREVDGDAEEDCVFQSQGVYDKFYDKTNAYA